ncbi:Cytochrome c oxidase subunit IV [Jatrophihabitans endophyticus]|uniref:Cytochrome c oxidase polypeptide 4 n=1 Tax=Jatrophihabitans endophyticus TaxID=1206085 RepID=A0A1M5L1U2_9ACTN|nr:cytochrome c oxidase subunit 4 [Jatrophihabitans endophyticus]SHG58956.1 Cytochrome c oxidase subunit IV [Jatrophihabitans endophyticus]
MKVEARVFLGVAVFMWLSAIGYGVWTSLPNSFSHGQIEPVGVAALILSGGLLGIPGSFFFFVSRRIDPRPEDRNEAEIAEMAGDFGFFSPGSYWPVGIALSAMVAGFALAFVQVWLLIVAVVMLMFTIGGLLFEYYTGGKRSPIA